MDSPYTEPTIKLNIIYSKETKSNTRTYSRDGSWKTRLVRTQKQLGKAQQNYTKAETGTRPWGHTVETFRRDTESWTPAEKDSWETSDFHKLGRKTPAGTVAEKKTEIWTHEEMVAD